MPSHRPAMMASVIRQLIAPVLRECPPACGIVSITTLDVSGDLSYATVYITALQQSELALTFLQDRAKDLQHTMAKELSLRKVPLLRFRLDHQVEKAGRLDALLDQLSATEDAPDA